MFAQVIFPLPFRNSFTYSIPADLIDFVKVGVRVVVPFGKRVLTGFVVNISEKTDVKEKIKPIRDVLDDKPIFNKDSLKFYEWISEYYISSLGEALKNSVPYGLDVESKRKIVADMELSMELYESEKNKKSIKAKILKLISEKETYKISQLQKLVKKKSIHSTLKSLEKKGALTILTEIEDAKVRIKKVKYVKLSQSVDETYKILPEIESRSPKQVVILLELLSANKPVQLSQLLKKTNTNQSSVTSLFKKNSVDIFYQEIERRYVETYEELKQDITLTTQQDKIVKDISQKITEQKFKTYLLHGVTGSGKTQVYIELVKKVLSINKTALVLVPEISLTPQITTRFYNNLGDNITVMHSRMSLGERYDAWRGVINGKYKIVIGPRSALFSPLKNIGLIIVDEEHDSSYKQYELTPKYNARDAAVVKGQLSNCLVLLGSATPSIESMYNAKLDKYELKELKERVDNAKLPKITLVDVTAEKKKQRTEGNFSKVLLEKINERLSKKENVIILQNRRGFATQIYCEDCGEIEMCDDCSVSMVHHINRNIMQCHYCGNTKPVPKGCSKCGSLSLKFFGTGTQRVEDELSFHFPSIKIERIDSDSISRKGKLGEILNRFRKGEIDILVGTQIVAKGLDFSNVTLVGVISAETTLWLPDFRADERTFQLLTQVAGRAGRSKAEGEVIIQTQNKSHFVLQKVLLNDYDGFYENEISLRERNEYPPFARLCLIETKDENENNARGAISDYYKIISKNNKYLKLVPPAPALIAKIQGKYRYHLIVRSYKKNDPGGKILRNAILNSMIKYNQKSRYRDIKLYIDMDPQNII